MFVTVNSVSLVIAGSGGAGVVTAGSLLLDAAGVPKDAFYQANTLLRERCEGRYLTCKDSKVLASYHDYVFNSLKDLRDE